MLPSSSYDAYFVQHANGASGSNNVHPAATHSNPHSPFSALPMMSSNSNGLRAIGQSGGAGAGLEPLNDNDYHHQRNLVRQSPSTPTSHLPWHPSTPSSSKEVFGSPLQQSWSDYQTNTYQQENDSINHAHFYSHYTNPLGSAFDSNHVSGSVYDDGTLTSSFIPSETSFLLNRYDLGLIGDDSGSGGTTRPKPKKKKKVTKNEIEALSQGKMGGVFLDSSNEKRMEALFTNSLQRQGLQEPVEVEVEQSDIHPAALLDESTTTTSSTTYNEGGDIDTSYPKPESAEDEPLYVNPKQYRRILKRREVRARMDEKRRRTEEAIRTGKLDIKKLPKGRDVAKVTEEDDKKVRNGRNYRHSHTARGVPDFFSLLVLHKQSYQHESRHKHAMRRPRGPGGRFLTAEEIRARDEADFQQEQKLQIADHDEDDNRNPPSHGYFGPPSLVDPLNEMPSQEDEDEAYNLLNLE
jgi:hypothetical protein